MKNLLILLVSVISLAACQNVAEEKKDKAAVTSSNSQSIQWVDTTFQDLGRIKKGQMLEITYRFKNVSDQQLVIVDVHPDCGCTVPEKPKEPIGPGQEGLIKAVFNSQNQHTGEVRKFVTVRTNSTPDIRLGFRAEVTD